MPQASRHAQCRNPSKTPSNPFAGYIGGTALDYIIRAHPDWEYHVLVRDEYRAEPIAAKYPYVRFTYGTLEDDAILERASSQADIVVRTLTGIICSVAPLLTPAQTRPTPPITTPELSPLPRA